MWALAVCTGVCWGVFRAVGGGRGRADHTCPGRVHSPRDARCPALLMGGQGGGVYLAPCRAPLHPH